MTILVKKTIPAATFPKLMFSTSTGSVYLMDSVNKGFEVARGLTGEVGGWCTGLDGNNFSDYVGIIELTNGK